jgi:hypothetical protein
MMRLYTPSPSQSNPIINQISNLAAVKPEIDLLEFLRFALDIDVAISIRR